MLNTNEAVLKKWSRKFQFIMVDEYQDTNHVQYKLVELLASDNKNICVEAISYTFLILHCWGEAKNKKKY